MGTIDTWQDDLDRFVDALKAHFGSRLVSVVLYGSRARGTHRPDSDIDLLVICRELSRSRFERHREMFRLAKLVSREFATLVSVVPLTPQEATGTRFFYLGMYDGHAILQDVGGFFAGVLARLRTRLEGLGAQRLVDKDGYPYWVLKKDWTPGEVLEL